MSSDSKRYDVAIVGAGPAGSAAAIRLSLSGLKVALIEQKAFPRHKLCGEFISPECLTHFAELGVLSEIKAAGGTDLEGTIFFSRSGKSVEIESSWFGDAGSLGLGLSRAEMDARLLERARETGVVVFEETSASGVLIDGERVVGIKVRDKAGTVTFVLADITIDATGRTRGLARRFDKKAPKAAAEFVAFKANVRGAKLTRAACEIYVYNGGYGGCNRVEGDLYNLCFIVSAELTKRLGSEPERVMREVLCSNSRAAEVLADAEVVSEWFAVPITRFGRGDLTPADGLIAIGDAAAFIDPFTGSGILLALESGRIAANAIAEHVERSSSLGDFGIRFTDLYKAAFDRRLRICSLLRHAAFVPFAAEGLIAALGFSRSIRRRIARSTRGPSEPGLERF